MSEAMECIECINDFLHKPHQGEHDNPRAFLIHNTIIEKFKTTLRAKGFPNFDQHTFEYTLRIGKHEYPMLLVWIRAETQDHIEYLSDITLRARFSCFWEPHPVIYYAANKFDHIKTFLAQQPSLRKSIDRICHETHDHETDIKVVHFKATTPKTVEQQFIQFNSGKVHTHYMYYVTEAFDFLSAQNLKYFEEYTGETNKSLTLILYLVLDYHRRRKRTKNVVTFNLADLCAMKLALDDPRCENVCCDLVDSIEKTLRELKTDRTFIKSNTMDLGTYAINHGIQNISNSVYQYFVYRFQSYFKKIIYFIPGTGWYSFVQKFIEISLSDMTNMENLLKFLETKRKGTVRIIGTKFKKMSGELLVRLIRAGVRDITLDTRYKWLDNQFDGLISDDTIMEHVIIRFQHDNRNNFIENCLNWLKFTLKESLKYWSFHFEGTNINHPVILNNLFTVQLIFLDWQINLKVLYFLKRCTAKRIYIKCHLPDDVKMIESIDRTEFNGEFILIEQYYTFENIFKYIENYLSEHNTSEFQFKYKLRVGFANLEEYKFIRNTVEERIDVIHLESGRLGDMYQIKNFDGNFFKNDENNDVDEEYDFYN